MAITLVAEATVAGASGGTTAAVNTTGANFIVLVTAQSGTTTVSDNKGNTYTPLTLYTVSGGGSGQLYYCTPATVGAGHTFTISTSFGVLTAMAFSGMASSSVFQAGTDSGAFGFAVTTLQPGSTSPTGSSLIISGTAWSTTGATVSIGTPSFNSTYQTAYAAGSNLGGAGAYLIQASGSTLNPTWTYTVSQAQTVAFIAAFAGAATTPIVSNRIPVFFLGSKSG